MTISSSGELKEKKCDSEPVTRIFDAKKVACKISDKISVLICGCSTSLQCLISNVQKGYRKGNTHSGDVGALVPCFQKSARERKWVDFRGRTETSSSRKMVRFRAHGISIHHDHTCRC
jgi:hypothetical protein